jgi:RNA polymerase sigma-70 factor (ECF subfamily)
MAPSASPGFESTQWSMVLAARNRASAEAETALATLCATYWRPLYSYVRRSGRSVEDAQDLTQSFFSRLLEKDSLRQVDPSLGKFRAFLLAALRNFLTNEWRREQTWKRGGQARFLSTEEMTRGEEYYSAGGSLSETPDQIFERNWALAILESTTRRLEEEFSAAGKSLVFAHLKPYLEGDGDGVRYSQVAAALEWSEVTVRVAVHRMRGRFRDLLQQEVARTLADPNDRAAIEAELRYLLNAL